MMKGRSAIAITGACLLTWLVGATLIAPSAGAELWLGMMLPLVMAVGTLTLFQRAFARDPRRLTPLMIKAFGVKMVLVGAYVGTVIGLTSLDPVPFVASFSLYFIGLHLTEALQLRSLFADTAS